jgi:hypothetical protein
MVSGRSLIEAFNGPTGQHTNPLPGFIRAGYSFSWTYSICLDVPGCLRVWSSILGATFYVSDDSNTHWLQRPYHGPTAQHTNN